MKGPEAGRPIGPGSGESSKTTPVPEVPGSVSDPGSEGPASAIVVLSERDPIARAVAAYWGTPPATGEFVDGTAVRRLAEGVLLLRRAGLHLEDDHLDQRLPAGLARTHPTLLFPSIHRSEREVPCFTVHPLGNPGDHAELGGRPRTLVPTDPLRMTHVLRRLAEPGRELGLPATFEATHHGPELGLPAFFAEIGRPREGAPSPDEVRALAEAILDVPEGSGDRVALAVGGGHYVPHFTDLALERRWAFGHLLSRHALEGLTSETARAAWEGTPRASGILYARAEDRSHSAFAGLGRPLRDAEAPRRARGLPSTSRNRSASGT